MIKRRNLLQLGIAVSGMSFLPAFPALSAPAQAAPASVPARTPVSKILYDTRFQGSMALARALPCVPDVSPATLHPCDGNITKFWADDLSALWRESAQPIAGVTGERLLFCVAQFAREKRTRVVWQKIHDDCLLCDPVTGASEKLVSWLIARPEPA